MSPVWSYRYGVVEAELDSDPDGDGMSSLHEAAFGTNPHDPASVARLVMTWVSASEVRATWQGIPGIGYEVQGSPDGKVWQDPGEVVFGTGAPMSVQVGVGLNVWLLRLRAVPPRDADGDGLNDFEEDLLHSSPVLGDSDGDGVADGQELSSGRDPIRVDPVTFEGGMKSISGSHMIRVDGSLWTIRNDGLGTGGSPKLSAVRVGQDSDWKQVTDAGHTLAIKNDGSLWAWGSNTHGQLGLGKISNTPESTPVRVGMGTDWSQVEAGGMGTVAIKNDASLWEWGTLQYSTESNVPKRVGTDTNWRMAASGNYHRLAVKTDGTLWAWGTNENAQLGLGTVGGSQSSPRQVGTDTDWVDARAAGDYSVAVKSNGTLWVWGHNPSGLLSVGSSNPHVTTPTQLGEESDWTLGGSVASALRSNGTIWYWFGGLRAGMGGCRAFSGNLALKQDGSVWVLNQVSFARSAELATGANQTTPRRFDPYLWRAVGLTSSGTTAIRDDGSLWGWPNMGSPSRTREQVGSDTDWMALAAGNAHALLLKSNRTLWGFGGNWSGQLGIGTPQSGVALPVPVGAEADWHQVSAGGDRSFALKPSGELWGWGDNSGGKLGEPAAASVQPTPIRIGTALWTQVAPRSANNVGIQADGSLWTWGINMGGTGASTPSEWKTPVPVMTGHQWRHVAGGSGSWLAIRLDGTLWAWGSNDRGQLGTGRTNSSPVLTPVQIGTDTDWHFVACRMSQSLAIKNDGSLWGWGDNGLGQLGDGTTTNRTSPTRIGTDTDWLTVSCGNAHTAALKKEGSLWLWGGKELLGITYPTGPLQIGTDRNWGR